MGLDGSEIYTAFIFYPECIRKYGVRNLVMDTSLPEVIMVFLNVQAYISVIHMLGHNRSFQTFQIHR